jgi:hypothetical protein
VLIEQVIADDRPVPFSSDLILPPGKGKLEIHYTSIRLGSPERLGFKYWMEGFESEWTAAGQRRVAYYTNIPSGRYRFHVVAYEMNAPKSVTEQVLSVDWGPHFHQTPWFLALCVTIATTVAWGAHRLHVRHPSAVLAVLDSGTGSPGRCTYRDSRLCRRLHVAGSGLPRGRRLLASAAPLIAPALRSTVP